jgi:precorrin-8X/cobalt-precorrin-8 methylmutase
MLSERRLFDGFVMVDWSGGSKRRSGKKDCIWIGHGTWTAAEPTTSSPASRTEAERAIRSIIESIAGRNGSRVLVCADFAYGYPAGFAALLDEAQRTDLLPWRVVWRYLSRCLKDDIATNHGQLPTNRNNRFDVAAEINARASSPSSPGPFWCLMRSGSVTCIPQSQPAQPFVARNGNAVASLRATDIRATSDTPFRLFGTGSVGGQVLTGIPRLERLRFDPQLRHRSRVWPFETGWATEANVWLQSDVQVLHAEIYPSVRDPLPDAVKDRGQVRAMWHWARDLDAEGRLIQEFAIPEGVLSGSPKDVLVRAEEGWILGCP